MLGSYVVSAMLSVRGWQKIVNEPGD
jgi:hypothetical protein